MNRKSQKREKLKDYIPLKSILRKMSSFHQVKMIRLKDLKKTRKKKINMKKYLFKKIRRLKKSKRLKKKIRLKKKKIRWRRKKRRLKK